jgi:hypothetical protein
MTNDAADLKDRLEQLAEAFGDPRHVDIGRARRRGRRILLCRRAAVTVGGGGVAAGLAAVLAISVLPAQPGRGTSGSRVGLRPSALSDVYADPLSQTASFGWLPSGFRVAGYVADRQGRPYFQVEATSGAGASIWLTDDGRGPRPGLPLLPGGGRAAPAPAAPVNGRPASWAIEPVAGARAQVNFDLQWEYAPGSWADLQASGWPGVSSAVLATDAHKIAETATFSGEGAPVAMPLHVAGIPAGLHLVRTALTIGPKVSALIEYAGPGTSGSDSLQIAVHPAGSVPHHPGRHSPAEPQPIAKGIATNTSLGGHPAYDSQIGDAGAASAALWVFGIRGFDVQIDASGAVLQALNRHGGLAGLFSRTALYPALSEWTVTPIN